MTVIDYKRGLAQSQIDSATFNLCNEKSLVLSVVDVYDIDDGERIIGQALKLLVRDNNYGEEELFVELDINDGVDLVKILQRMLRQINKLAPEERG